MVIIQVWEEVCQMWLDYFRCTSDRAEAFINCQRYGKFRTREAS